MNISPVTTKTSFTGYAEDFKNIKNEYKAMGKNKTMTVDALKDLKLRLESVEKAAKGAITNPNEVPALFPKLLKWFGKSKSGNKAIDAATALTSVVLWGNVGKEAVGTTIYTVQALTNEDLPKDKRKFVGMYDLAVGVVSTTLSFILGVGLQAKVNNGYKNLLAPIKTERSAGRIGIAIAGLSALTSFGLQTIVGKRIIAPAIATPTAGRLKTYFEQKEEAKKNVAVD